MNICRLTQGICIRTFRVLAICLIVCPFIDAAQISSKPTVESRVEQRILRIQNEILPLVLVKGEIPRTTKLADRMSELQVPGVSIAVVHNRKIEWTRGFGVTKEGGPSITPGTLFQAASISKPLTAMAVLRLVESGKLDLDVDVNQYLKSWKIPSNSFTSQSKVTLRRLLTHTAGMTVHGFAGYASDTLTPGLLQVLNGEEPANSAPIIVDMLPGKVRRYSGGGYVVIQQLLEDITGQSFPELMQNYVLDPLGMTASSYEQPLPKDGLMGAAMPHTSTGQVVKGGPHVYPEMAAAGLWTTPTDLARFIIDLQASLSGGLNHVLSPKMARAMLSGDEYGLGINIGGSNDQAYFSHGGSNVGYRCNLVAYNDGDGIAIMTNGDNGGQLASEILNTVAHEYDWPDFQPTERTQIVLTDKALERFVGTYQMAPNINIMIMLEGGQLHAQVPGQGTIPLFPESERKFFLKIRDAEIEFLIDEYGVVTHLELQQNGGARKFPRIDN